MSIIRSTVQEIVRAVTQDATNPFGGVLTADPYALKTESNFDLLTEAGLNLEWEH